MSKVDEIDTFRLNAWHAPQGILHCERYEYVILCNQTKMNDSIHR